MFAFSVRLCQFIHTLTQIRGRQSVVENRSRENLSALMLVRGVSGRELAREIGVDKSTFPRFFKGGDIASGTLFDAIMFLGSDPNTVFGVHTSLSVEAHDKEDAARMEAASILTRRINAADTGEGSPSFERVLLWWRATGGELRDYDWLKPHADIYGRPTEPDTVVPKVIGDKSLMALRLEGISANKLAEVLDGTPSDFRSKVVNAHLKTLEGGPQLTCEVLEVQTRDEAISIAFDRLLLPVRYPDSDVEFILNYSKHVGPVEG